MYSFLVKKAPRDLDLSARTFKLYNYMRALNGEMYNHLPFNFYQESFSDGKPIPLTDRIPCVQYRLPKLIVDDSVSLLFGDGHFPTIETKDEQLRETLERIKEVANLKSVMITAATIGSIGSVAIWMRITDGYLNFKVLNTCYLTPIFSESRPDQLVAVHEKYKSVGADLIASGYFPTEIPELSSTDYYWVERIWDETQELRYVPYKVFDQNREKNFVPQVDKKRSHVHNLGFVPIIWIKNLESDDDIDGNCTFEPALNNVIEIDYQLSQAGRALRYSGSPALVVKDNSPIDDSITLSPDRALKIDADSDVKYLELDGSATATVLKFVEELRKLALENIHGNRANPDKLTHAQSGRAIELLYQPLVWLADRLRITYGKGLLQLLNMIVAASYKYKINLSQSFLYDEEGAQIVKNLNRNSQIHLRWNDWFNSTTYDKLETANALRALTDSGVLSKETATKSIATEYGIADVTSEISKIAVEQANQQQMLQPQVKETINA